MKQLIQRIRKVFAIHIVSFRYYSINDWICTIGGLLVCLMIPLLIALIWCDQVFVLKMIATNILLITLIWLLDRATK